jgi:hypothetical protein
VATMLVLLPGNVGDPAPGPEFAGRLARLGVTRAVVLRDRTTVGVVLEGWAFDPARSGREAVAVVSAQGSTRALQPVAEISVSPEADDHGPERA